MPETWTAAAELLADGLREHGFACAYHVAVAWRARVHPDATRSLVNAAVILAGTDAMAALWAPLPPSPDGETWLRGAEEIESEVAAAGRHAERMAKACEDAHERAIAEYETARKQVNGDDQTAAPDAQMRMREIRPVIGDCEAALDILGAVLERLAAAYRCLIRVPSDLYETYEPAYQHIRDGGTLPWSGDFLTGTAAR